jgi:hypothetical protein
MPAFAINPFVASDGALRDYHLVANRAANQKSLLLWWRYWLVGVASEPLRLRVAGSRRGPAYWALWLPRRAAWRCWRIAALLSALR